MANTNNAMWRSFMMKKIKNAILYLILIAIGVLFGYTLCFGSQSVNNLMHDDPEPTTSSSTAPDTTHIVQEVQENYLNINVKQSETGYYSYSSDCQAKTNTNSIRYLNLKSVEIELNGICQPLETAIYDGMITVEEICLFARLDAKHGNCEETFFSENGLSSFTYSYPEFNLIIVHDIYETPDGMQHLINEITFCISESDTKRIYVNDAGTPIDREDWGVTFEVNETTPTSVALSIHQEAGQIIGEITPRYFYLVTDEDHVVATLEDSPSVYHSLEQKLIKNNTITELTIDWTSIYGPLSKGNYLLILQLTDIYDETEIHPLLQNYWDDQIYSIEFSID